MSYIILVVSFLLDGIISFLLNKNIILNPLFSLCSLVIIFRYQTRQNKTKYFLLAFLLGLFYDIVYTNTLFLNAGIFLIISLIIVKFYKIFSYNLLNSIIMTLVVIIIYRSLNFIVISSVGLIDFDLSNLFKSIYSSLILNIIYISLYFLKKKKYKIYLSA